MECNDKNIAGKITNSVRSTRSNSPTGNTGASSVLPIGDSIGT